MTKKGAHRTVIEGHRAEKGGHRTDIEGAPAKKEAFRQTSKEIWQRREVTGQTSKKIWQRRETTGQTSKKIWQRREVTGQTSKKRRQRKKPSGRHRRRFCISKLILPMKEMAQDVLKFTNDEERTLADAAIQQFGYFLFEIFKVLDYDCPDNIFKPSSNFHFHIFGL